MGTYFSTTNLSALAISKVCVVPLPSPNQKSDKQACKVVQILLISSSRTQTGMHVHSYKKLNYLIPSVELRAAYSTLYKWGIAIVASRVLNIHTHTHTLIHRTTTAILACMRYGSVKTQQLYLLLPIPKLRGNHPIACSGKPNPSKRQSHLGA